MRMTVLGCGYLGAVHAPCMADLGHDVIGVDVSLALLALLPLLGLVALAPQLRRTPQHVAVRADEAA